MNPVAHFEQTAKRIWASHVEPDQKARQLTALSDQISSYLSKLDHLPAEKTAKQDEWVDAAIERARKYLNTLATDIRHLALHCQSQP